MTAVPEPTNPRKKSLMPSSPLRRKLRGAGHHLSAIVQVGKEGVTDAVLRQLQQALLDHELVKLKVGTESPEDRFEAAERLAAGAEAQLAQILGRTLLLYRKHPQKPRYEPGEPAKLGGRPTSTRPVGTARPAKPARQARPAKPARQAKAEKPARHGKPATPARYAKPAASRRPSTRSSPRSAGRGRR